MFGQRPRTELVQLVQHAVDLPIGFFGGRTIVLRLRTVVGRDVPESTHRQKWPWAELLRRWGPPLEVVQFVLGETGRSRGGMPVPS
jgi:hypothetical protein